MAVTVTVGCFTFKQTLAARLFHDEDDGDLVEEASFHGRLGRYIDRLL